MLGGGGAAEWSRVSVGQKFSKVFDGSAQTGFDVDFWCPAQGLRPGYVRATPNRIILRKGTPYDGRVRAGEANDALSQFQHGDFVGVAQVDGADFARTHQGEKSVDQIAHEAKRARLAPLTEDGQRLALQSLDDEVRNHAPVVWLHLRPVGIEDACYSDGDSVLSVVIEEEGFGATLSLVVASSRSDGIDPPPVFFVLRVNLGIAVDFACRSLKYSCAYSLGKT